MTPTSCKQNDCLCFFSRRERMDAPDEIYCLAGIRDPRGGSCLRYTPPSWKPATTQSKRKGF